MLRFCCLYAKSGRSTCWNTIDNVDCWVVGMRRRRLLFSLAATLPHRIQHNKVVWLVCCLWVKSNYRFATIRRIWNWIFFLLFNKTMRCLAFRFSFLPLILLLLLLLVQLYWWGQKASEMFKMNNNSKCFKSNHHHLPDLFNVNYMFININNKPIWSV